MFRLTLLWFCLVISLIGLAEPRAVADSSADESQLHAFFHEPFDPPLGYSLVLGDAKERVRSRFGQPNSRESAKYLSRTSDELLWDTAFSYDGMDISIGESEDRSASWIEVIEVTSNKWPLRFGVEVGALRADIERAFSGISPVENGSELRYDAEIWESRTDTKYRPGEEVTVVTGMELTLDLDENDRVSRIRIQNIEL